MRTLNFTGSESQFDYTAITSDAYSFVFEPNTLKITLGSGYSATQEVTISANGITQKRNCINRVCTFDLSTIFESYFADKDFTLNYAANADDPFYQSSFDLIVEVQGDLTEINAINYSLRWGAYQFDEDNAPSDFSFPIWLGKPLVINSSQEHDNWELFYGISSTGTGIKALSLSDAASSFLYITKLSSDIIQTISYYPETCPADGNYLQWVDTYGQIWHYMFYKNKEKKYSKTITSGEFIPYYPTRRFDSQNGLGKVKEKTTKRSFTCFQSIDESIYSIVESIISSPIVRYYTNDRWIEVKIKDSTYEPTDRGFIDIEFTVELPTDFNQKR